ncbi:hypothetical protein LTR91_024924 [Friedmanniomyces endolithicus]|uniref:F-box domain-containing protein n=1 Tax=Friedmanniomyces endolithicus TaxID=329885 RepID=A0A4U0UL68_9PEZI|nr:hypothetical protein LTS09_006569 [Friedmanniomyces endolithicus]KAK0356627.1 hypothetical protein LTR94_003481 [Friedmanniomyces endolithicus]KAK0773712.1 hypothetical protein LTR75_017058 [Friedmanniomyces endolithicus]KAK0792618.1 hypothetical protein LTR59_008428 [Friedmanniomyces endolithicus]KAK0794690.1 hypothetical protein LTR38_009187 [Friedmanniomyces endolithicus]
MADTFSWRAIPATQTGSHEHAIALEASKTHLFRLPPELRDLIYDHCIADIKTLRISKNSSTPTLPLAQVCHALRQEVLPVWHAQWPLTVQKLESEVSNFNFRNLSRFLQHLPPAARHAIAAARKLRVTVLLEPRDVVHSEENHKVLTDWLRDCAPEGLPSCYGIYEFVELVNLEVYTGYCDSVDACGFSERVLGEWEAIFAEEE